MRGVAHVTRMAEQDVLDYVYLMARDLEVDRIALLKQVADVALDRPSDWDTAAIRQALAGVRVTLTGDRCWCCRTEARWVYWHHIIQVQHGGSNTPRNLVPLCARCHRDVHPWLPEPTSRENRHGFTWFGDLASRAFKKLAAMMGSRSDARKSNGA